MSGRPRSRITTSGLRVAACDQARARRSRLRTPRSLRRAAPCAGTGGSAGRPRSTTTIGTVGAVMRRGGAAASPAISGGAPVERQREAEHGAARGQVLRRDRAAVRLDDRLADREAEPDAALRALRRAAVELLEDALLLARPAARALVGDRDDDARRGSPRAEIETVVPAGVYFDRVLEQVASTCSISTRVDVAPAGGRRDVRLSTRCPASARSQPREHRADDLLERMPLRGSGCAAPASSRAMSSTLSIERSTCAPPPRRSPARAPRVPAAPMRSPRSSRLAEAPTIDASGVRRSCEMAASSALRSRSVSAAQLALPAPRRRAARARARARSGSRTSRAAAAAPGRTRRRGLAGRIASTPTGAWLPAAAGSAPARRAACPCRSPAGSLVVEHPLRDRRGRRRGARRLALAAADAERARRDRAAGSTRLRFEHLPMCLTAMRSISSDVVGGAELAAHRVQRARSRCSR